MEIPNEFTRSLDMSVHSFRRRHRLRPLPTTVLPKSRRMSQGRIDTAAIFSFAGWWRITMSAPRRLSQPALLLGQSSGLDAIAPPNLLDGDREVIPDGTFRQPQPGRDIGDRRAVHGGRQDVSLARREGVVHFAERRQSQPWIEHSLAGGDPAYGTRQLRSGCILHEKAGGTALHRAPPVADAPERGQDD